MNAISLSLLGFISALFGGLISDRFGQRSPKTYSRVCIVGSLLAAPFAILAYTVTGNFWLSISCLALKYLFGEAWASPAMTMMQNTTDRGNQGKLIATHMFYTTMMGTLSTFICGSLANFLGAAANPIIYGRIVGGAQALSLMVSIPFFWLAGRAYTKEVE